MTTTTAMTAVTFTFLGVAGQGGTPLGNKSALDAAVMMATMSEFLREENLAPSGRLHWVINNGGDIPNVTPEIAEISYYVREGSPARVQVLLDKVIAVSEAAAKASRTTVGHRITSACWNQLRSTGCRTRSNSPRPDCPGRVTPGRTALPGPPRDGRARKPAAWPSPRPAGHRPPADHRW
ncbi:hypothetical protein ACNPQM_14420 [Streptomyces sp. NPDC056231]|uniref:hypothetical protein n=1 Tax=Streptomyces sp. NPDC056231 TaxID=3345755 RepID=UPI003AAB9AA3